MDIKRSPKSKLKKRVRTGVVIAFGVVAIGGITYGLSKMKPAAPTLDRSTAVIGTVKRGEMVRRSTPYAFHDGIVGLYFMGFCREQAPLRERMEAIYGMNGQPRDALTDYSTPASGSFYFAPSVETLDAVLD